MRKLLILFFAASLFVACNNDKKDDRRSSRDRDRERDDYRDKEDDRRSDDRKTDYADDREERSDRDTDRKTSEGWPERDKEEFVSSCIREAVNAGSTRSVSERYCECMVEKMEALYPDVNDAARLTEDDVNAIVAKYKDKCIE